MARVVGNCREEGRRLKANISRLTAVSIEPDPFIEIMITCSLMCDAMYNDSAMLSYLSNSELLINFYD